MVKTIQQMCLCCCWLLLAAVSLHGQGSLDSLRAVWEDIRKPDSSRIAALIKAGKDFYAVSQYDSSLRVWKQAEVLTIQQSDSLGLAKLGTLIQRIYLSKGDYSTVDSINRRSLAIFLQKNDSVFIAKSRMNIGALHLRKNEYNRAEEEFSMALDIATALEEPGLRGRIYANMGIIREEKGEYEEAIELYNKSLALKQQYDDTISIGKTLMNIGIVHARQQHYLEALDHLNQSVVLFRKVGAKRQLSMALFNIGSLHKMKNNYKEAIRLFMETRQVFEEIDDQRSLAFCLLNIGNLYSKLYEHERAREFLAESKETFVALGYPRGVAKALHGLGSDCTKAGDNELALDFFDESLEAFRNSHDKQGEMTCLSSMGYTHIQIENYGKAFFYYKKSMKIAKDIGATREMANCLVNISTIYRQQENSQAAIQYGIRGLNLAKEKKDWSRISGATKVLWESYKANGQYSKALEMYELHATAEDSLHYEENRRAVLHQEYAFEYRQKALSDSLAFVQQQGEQALQFQTKLIQRNYLVWAAIAVGLLSILFLRYRQIRKNREKALVLEKQRAEATRLREIDELKTQLYNNITHEFRTPLTVIQGMSEEAKSHFEQGDIAGFEQAMSMIQRNGNNLLHLVNQMLDLAKLESGSLQMNYVHGDVVSYLSYICESFHSYAESQNTQLTVYREVNQLKMDYDPVRLLSMVSNLLSNAIKFTPNGGKVIFHIAQEGEKLQIKVQDNGQGIVKEELPHVFDRFFQSKEQGTGTGSGIGLALVKELVQAMDGRISAESEAGKGSTFSVLLPLRKLAEKQATQEAYVSVKERVIPYTVIPEGRFPAKVTSEENKPLVLIVEDNLDVQHYLQQCLYGDFNILLANDGQEGIEKAITEVPDLIISDVMMPRQNGFELCEALKQDEHTSHIPIVMLTARASVEDRIAGLRKGADTYLAKPFNREELRVSIRNLIVLRQSLQQRYSLGMIKPELGLEGGEIDLGLEDVFVTKVKDFILSQLDNSQLGVEGICREIGMSRTQLHRKLKALTGLSTTRFVRSIRLGEARNLLAQPELSISEVAYQSGFSDPAYFSRVFSQEFGESPTEFKE